MGYACPVCETPQADARHLANHLAFTAMLGDDDHETWLEEYAPGWADAGENDLADRVVEHAESAEYPQVFEDTTGHDHRDHDSDDPRPGELFEESHHEWESSRTRGPGARGGTDLDPETAAAVEKARGMTRQANEADDASDAADATDDRDVADDTADASGDENG